MRRKGKFSVTKIAYKVKDVIVTVLVIGLITGGLMTISSNLEAATLDGSVGDVGVESWAEQQVREEDRDLAREILECQVADNSDGATTYYSPQSMPPADAEVSMECATEDMNGDGREYDINCAPDADIAPGSDSFEIAFIEENGNEDLVEEVDGQRHYQPWYFNQYFLERDEVCAGGECVRDYMDGSPLGTRNIERVCVGGIEELKFKFYKSGSVGEKNCETRSAPEESSPGVCDDIGASEPLSEIDANIDHMAIILGTESSDYSAGSEAKRAIGYTVLNRMRNRGTTQVEDVACGYSGYLEATNLC